MTKTYLPLGDGEELLQAMIRGYCWFSAQGSVLVVLKEPYMVSRVQAG